MTKTAETATDNLDQAFEAALAEHSVKEQPSEAAGAVEAESTGDTKTGDETQSEQQTDKAADAPVETAEEQLLTDEEFAQLGNDPKVIRKRMNQAFTQKTQALAAQRKKLAGYENLIDNYEKDPAAVVKQLAEQHGLVLQPKGDKPAGQDQATETTQEVADNTVEILREALGPELHGLADALAPAIKKLVAQQASTLIEKKVKPLEEGERQRQAKERQDAIESARANAKEDLKALGIRHKDWKQFEPKMLELSKQLLPGTGMSSADYLDTLYYLASKDHKAAVTAKKVVTKINEVVNAAETPESGAPTHTVSSASTAPDLDESIRMAMKGETVDAD